MFNALARDAMTIATKTANDLRRGVKLMLAKRFLMHSNFILWRHLEG